MEVLLKSLLPARDAAQVSTAVEVFESTFIKSPILERLLLQTQCTEYADGTIPGRSILSSRA